MIPTNTIKFTITDSLRFHLNLFSTHLTSGSKKIAVSNAKMIGIETGRIKNTITNKTMILKANMIFLFVSNFKSNRPPRRYCIYYNQMSGVIVEKAEEQLALRLFRIITNYIALTRHILSLTFSHSP